MFVFQSCCRAVRSADHFNNVESVVAEECTVAPTLDSSMMRSKSEIRILQKPIPQNYHGIVAKARPRSLFEASAIRVAKHSSNKRHMTGQPDTDNQGIPGRFMDAYLAALRDSNVRWASESEIAGLFTEHARLVGQDKQVTVGKAAVLKRLDQGVETLIKMAGKDASLPEFEVKGPILTEALAHRYECTIKRGAFKFAFAQEFIIIGGRISQLSSSRI